MYKVISFVLLSSFSCLHGKLSYRDACIAEIKYELRNQKEDMLKNIEDIKENITHHESLSKEDKEKLQFLLSNIITN